MSAWRDSWIWPPSPLSHLSGHTPIVPIEPVELLVPKQETVEARVLYTFRLKESTREPAALPPTRSLVWPTVPSRRPFCRCRASQRYIPVEAVTAPVDPPWNFFEEFFGGHHPRRSRPQGFFTFTHTGHRGHCGLSPFLFGFVCFVLCAIFSYRPRTPVRPLQAASLESPSRTRQERGNGPF